MARRPVESAIFPEAPPAPPAPRSRRPPSPSRGEGVDPATVAVPEAVVDPAEAEAFLLRFHTETSEAGDLDARLAQVRADIARTGTYTHSSRELAFGAQVAWRNSARCIGRYYWRSLHLRDRRHVGAAPDVAAECVAHLRESTRGGRIRSTITVFAPDAPAGRGPRIANDQLVRYAGYRRDEGSAPADVLGDPGRVGLTDLALRCGWTPPTPLGRFDVLPLMVHGADAEPGPACVDVPPDAVLEVSLRHPRYPWFADLDLRWHAVPAISDMSLEVGGLSYPAAPFNGWYMATEIGARNLADTDRYDLLAEVAERLGLDTSDDRSLWRDRAAVELTTAVQYSFDAAGVSMTDHHTESRRFLRHVEREEAAGRDCPTDWSWIVPPISGGLTPVFHRYYDPPREDGPRFVARSGGCPVAAPGS